MLLLIVHTFVHGKMFCTISTEHVAFTNYKAIYASIIITETNYTHLQPQIMSSN